MADDSSIDEPSERGESSSKRRGASEPSESSKKKVISIVVGLVVVMIAMLQLTRMSQRQLREMQLEEMATQYKQQIEFRDKAIQRRFDTIENNKQADMLESRFKPLEEPAGSPTRP
ncbi:MAG: hypothetical protein HQM02_05230 [Magnetococcales bacterium]|nr:hypothetical protein [Magnetococcales bacterium]